MFGAFTHLNSTVFKFENLFSSRNLLSIICELSLESMYSHTFPSIITRKFFVIPLSFGPYQFQYILNCSIFSFFMLVK